MGLVAQEIEHKTKHLDLLELSFCSKLLRNACLCRSETFLGFCLQNFSFQDFILVCDSFGGYPVKCFTKKTSVLHFLCTQVVGRHLGKAFIFMRDFTFWTLRCLLPYPGVSFPWDTRPSYLTLLGRGYLTKVKHSNNPQEIYCVLDYLPFLFFKEGFSAGS